MDDSPSTFVLARRVVKGLAIGLGGLCTFVMFSSLVGVVTGNGWARALIALLVTVALPALALDRFLPKDKKKPRPGLVSDVVAMTLVGLGLAFVGIGQPITRPLLVHEGDRVAESGWEVPAHVVYFLAGVRPVDALHSGETAPPAGPSAAPSAVPSAAPSASAAPGPSASGGG
jgi:hypothetical protein